MWKTYVAVMFGGAIGTGLRMWLSGVLTARFGEHFPVGVLVVNVLGSFVIGLVAALTAPDGATPAPLLLRQIVMIGVLGGFTTFSSFSLQTLGLLSSGEWGRAALNTVLSVVLCLVAVWLGHVLAQSVGQR
jgi:CrcB protein